MVTREIMVPSRKRRVLVFDVETTGKLPKQGRGAPSPSFSEYPHILQLSFVIYDLAERAIVYSYDSYVNVAQDVVISDFISEFTGITREKCDSGKNIVDVLTAFYDAYMRADCLVAHNIEFDTKLIEIELIRHREAILERAPYCLTIFNEVYEKMNNIERYCTMKKGTKMCAIPSNPVVNIPTVAIDASSGLHPLLQQMMSSEIAVVAKPAGRMMNKWPKLVELYEMLFQEKAENLHNSMNDVLACLRCYVKMRHGYDNGLLG
jgi:DNA polymerase III epsilon subunit-like protein